MANWRQTLYNTVPWSIKELLVMAEAWRRNRYRRYGDYGSVKQEYSFDWYKKLSRNQIQEKQVEKFNRLAEYTLSRPGFYSDRLSTIKSIEELSQFPILTKDDLRANQDSMIDPAYNKKHLWFAVTSGSTGTPLRFAVGREGIRARFAILDNYYATLGCHYSDPRVRMGGSKIQPADSQKPPFWIMNRVDRQLQVSPYHLDESTFPAYREKLNEYQPIYFTGYGHALYNLAQFYNQHGGRKYVPKAIFIDSEGVPAHYHDVIEEGFGTKCYENYGIGEIGAIAVQTQNKNYHVLELSCILEIVDDDGNYVADGEPGRLIVTDLTQSAAPYIRYDTGDIGSFDLNPKDSEYNSICITRIEGRADEMIITPKGRHIGRLSHVTKPGRGILESQIAQTALDQIEIRVVPTPSFDPESMQEVVQVAQELLGTDMKIEWHLVDEIPRSNRHKFKHVVREFD